MVIVSTVNPSFVKDEVPHSFSQKYTTVFLTVGESGVHMRIKQIYYKKV